MIKNRIEKLKIKMKEANIEAVVLFSSADIRYFTGIGNIEGVLVISSFNEQKLFVSPLYETAAKDLPDKNLFISTNGIKDIVEYLKKADINKIGIDFLETKASHFQELSSFLVSDFTNQTKIMRMIKEKEEINSIKRAAIAARNAFIKVYPYIKEGISEKDIADELTYQIRKAGAQKESFETIVASGENAAKPHHIPTEKKIKNGEFLVIDFGAHIDGYNSDNTLTFLIGEKDKEKKELFNAVFYAQLFATEMIAPGKTKAKEIEERARKELAKYGLDKYFIHSLGHGVGLEVHEFPHINLKSDITIQPGMVFTIEPGIYIPGKLGIRLEHMVLAKENDTEIIAFTPFMEVM